VYRDQEVIVIPQIDNGKEPQQPLNIVHMMWLPDDTPYGNLALKGMNIIRRIDRVNLEIRRVFLSYVHPSREEVNNPQQDVLEHQFYEEQVVYWLRKTSDELISLAYVIDEWNRTGKWPPAVKIDSIAGLIHGSPSSELQQLFGPHEQFLFTLNDVANSFKHSFINTDIIVAGSEYPVVYALALKYNKLSETPIFYQVHFEQLVNQFSTLFKKSRDTIQGWAASGKTKHHQVTKST
jgi:hypothetical protein